MIDPLVFILAGFFYLREKGEGKRDFFSRQGRRGREERQGNYKVIVTFLLIFWIVIVIIVLWVWFIQK